MSRRAPSYYDSDLPPSSPLQSSDFDYGYSTASSPPPSSPIATHSAFEEFASIAASSSPIRIPDFSDWNIVGKPLPIRGPRLNPISPKRNKFNAYAAPSYGLPSLRDTLNTGGFPVASVGTPPRLYNSAGEIPVDSDSDADREDEDVLVDDPFSDDEMDAYPASTARSLFFTESSERYAPLPPRPPPMSTPSRRRTHSTRQQRHSISTSSPSKFRDMFVQGSSRMASEPAADLPDELAMDLDLSVSENSLTPEDSPALVTPPIDQSVSMEIIERKSVSVQLPQTPDIVSSGPSTDSSLAQTDLVATSSSLENAPDNLPSTSPITDSLNTSSSQSPASTPSLSNTPSPLDAQTTPDSHSSMDGLIESIPYDRSSAEPAPVEFHDTDAPVEAGPKKRKTSGSRSPSPGPSKRIKTGIPDDNAELLENESLANKGPDHAELLGMIIETLAASRASSMTTKAIWRDLSRSRPHVKSEHILSEKEWIATLRDVLEDNTEVDGGVFGKVEKNRKVKDPAFPDRRGGDPQWFYVPGNDPDQERATLLKAIMPRSSGKRAATKTLKRYYFKPLEPLKSAWEEEGEY